MRLGGGRVLLSLLLCGDGAAWTTRDWYAAGGEFDALDLLSAVYTGSHSFSYAYSYDLVSSTTSAPTASPSELLQTDAPTPAPGFFFTPAPSPSASSPAPSLGPSASPTASPTWSPSVSPTPAPSETEATPGPTRARSPSFTLSPTGAPSSAPTFGPTPSPTIRQTRAPAAVETLGPTSSPTEAPSPAPSLAPTPAPSLAQTLSPTGAPSLAPSAAPTFGPSPAPSASPTSAPVDLPSPAPTLAETFAPTASPSPAPVADECTPAPSSSPTASPSLAPTPATTRAPARSVTPGPTPAPFVTFSPTSAPTAAPSYAPTQGPSPAPSLAPTPAPTRAPTRQVAVTPGPTPAPFATSAPSLAPTLAPTPAPSPAPAPVNSTPGPTPAPEITFSPTAAPVAPETPAPAPQGPTPGPTAASPTPANTFAPSAAPTSATTNAPTRAPSAPPAAATPSPTAAPLPDLPVIWDGSQQGGTGNDAVYAAASAGDTAYVAGSWTGAFAETRAAAAAELTYWGGGGGGSRRLAGSGSAEDSDVYVAAFVASTGALLWSSPYVNGSSNDDAALALTVDSVANEVVMTGYTGGSFFGDSAGGVDLFLLGLGASDGAVKLMWQGGGSGDDTAYSVVVDESTGDYILAGSTTSDLCSNGGNTSTTGPFVVRLTANGVANGLSFSLATLWCVSDFVAAGASADAAAALSDGVFGLTFASDGNFVAAVGASGYADPNSMSNSASDATQAALYLNSTSGAVAWSDGGSAGVSKAAAATYDQEGIVVAGFTSSGSASASTLVQVQRRNSSDGELVWDYAGSRGGRALGVSAAATGGEVVAAGMDADSQGFVLVLSGDDGSEVCYYSFGASSSTVTAIYGLTVDYPNVTVSGSTTGSLFTTNAGGEDLFVAAFDLSDEAVCPATATGSGASTNNPTGTTVATTAAVAASAAVIGTVVTLAMASSTGVGSPAAVVVAGYSAASGAGGGAAATMSAISQRTPAAAMCTAVVFQLQYSAILSIIDQGQQTAAFASFSDSLGWTNLWVSVGIGGSSTYFGSHNAHDTCIADSVNGVGGAAFVGNCIFAFGGLLLLFVLHLLAVSAIESYWLAKDAATRVAARASARELEAFESGAAPREGVSSLGLSGEGLRRELEAEEARAAAAVTPPPGSPTAGSEYAYDSGQDPYYHVLRRSPSFWLFWPHLELLWVIFVYQGALTAQASMLRSACGWLFGLALALIISLPLVFLAFAAYVVYYKVRHAGGSVRYIDYKTSGRYDTRNAFVKLRNGISAALREGDSFLVCFERGHWESRVPPPPPPSHSLPLPNPSSRGADVAAPDQQERYRRKADQIRVGFEPLYVGLTWVGAYYTCFILLQLLGVGLVAALVQRGWLQAVLLAALCLADLVVLVFVRPFSNVAINTLSALQELANLTTALMIAAATLWPAHRSNLFNAAMWLQLGVLVFLLIPLYVDTTITFAHALNALVRGRSLDAAAAGEEGGGSGHGVSASGRDKKRAAALEAQRRSDFAERRAQHTWRRYWAVMVGRNVRAFGANLRRSMRRHRGGSAAPVRPVVAELAGSPGGSAEADVSARSVARSAAVRSGTAGSVIRHRAVQSSGGIGGGSGGGSGSFTSDHGYHMRVSSLQGAADPAAAGKETRLSALAGGDQPSALSRASSYGRPREITSPMRRTSGSELSHRPATVVPALASGANRAAVAESRNESEGDSSGALGLEDKPQLT